jgi:hypothetical protein
VIGSVKKYLRELGIEVQVAFFLAKPVKIMRPMPIKSGVITSLFFITSGMRLNITPKSMHITPQDKRKI